MFADSLVAGKANGLFLAPRNAPMRVTPVAGLAGNFAELHAPASGEPAEKEPAVTVRSDFRSTVFWQPDVITDKEGSAVVKVKYPESLTSWKATVRAVTEGNQFGIADATVRTKQPLIDRLEAPRFFVVGDRVTISAVVNNNTEAPADVKVALDVTNVAAGSLAEEVFGGCADRGRRAAALGAGCWLSMASGSQGRATCASRRHSSGCSACPEQPSSMSALPARGDRDGPAHPPAPGLLGLRSDRTAAGDPRPPREALASLGCRLDSLRDRVRVAVVALPGLRRPLRSGALGAARRSSHP